MTSNATTTTPAATETTDCSKNGTERQLVFACAYSVVFSVGLALNVAALVVFYRTAAKSRSHTTVYMINLALSDLLLVLTLPLRVYHHLGFRGLSQTACEWAGLALLVNMYGSVFLLTCICFDRCVAVNFPMSSRVCEARKKAPLVCLAVWALTVGASLPNYLLARRRRANGEQLCFWNLPTYATLTVPLASTLTVGFLLPLTVMLVCSAFLIRAIRRSEAARSDLVNSGKIQRMVAASLLIFLVCFLPYHVVLALLYVRQGAVSCSLRAIYQYSLTGACLNAMLDPIAYYFTTETFRGKVDLDAVRKMFPLNSHSSNEGKQSKFINT